MSFGVGNLLLTNNQRVRGECCGQCMDTAGGGPGFGVYVGPRHRYGGYAYRHRPYYYDRYSYGYGPRWRYRHRDWDSGYLA
jgi:hypothetical protein